MTSSVHQFKHISLFPGREWNGMEWGGNRDPPCSADTEPLTTRHPRRDDLTFVERELSVRLFHFLSSPLFPI